MCMYVYLALNLACCNANAMMVQFNLYNVTSLSRFLWTDAKQFHPYPHVFLLWSVNHPIHAQISVVETLPHPGSAGQCANSLFN